MPLAACLAVRLGAVGKKPAHDGGISSVPSGMDGGLWGNYWGIKVEVAQHHNPDEGAEKVFGMYI